MELEFLLGDLRFLEEALSIQMINTLFKLSAYLYVEIDLYYRFFR